MERLRKAYSDAKCQRWRGEYPLVIKGIQSGLPFTVIPKKDRPPNDPRFDQPLNGECASARLGGGSFGCVYEGKMTLCEPSPNPAIRHRKKTPDYGVAVKFIRSNMKKEIMEDSEVKPEDKESEIRSTHGRIHRDFMAEGVWKGLNYPAINRFMNMDQGSYSAAGFWAIMSDLCRVEHLGEMVSAYYGEGRVINYQGRKFGEAALACITLGLACAIGYLHFLGFVHRDVKPSNVLLTKAFRPKLTDFGLMIQADDPELQTAQSGTREFMPPEVWEEPRRTKITHKFDVFSFGATLVAIFSTGTPLLNPPTTKGLEVGDRLLELIGHCIDENAATRWSIVRVIRTLEDPTIFSGSTDWEELHRDPAAFAAEYQEYKAELLTPDFRMAMIEFETQN